MSLLEPIIALLASFQSVFTHPTWQRSEVKWYDGMAIRKAAP